MRRSTRDVMLTYVAFGLPLFLIATWLVTVAAQAPLTILGLTIPEQVAGLPRAAQLRDYEKKYPGFGYSVAFKRPGWTITVYIYTLNLKSIPDDPTSEVMKDQLAQSKAEVFALEKKGNYSNVVVTSDYTVNDATGRTRFICSSFTYIHNRLERSVDSYLCVTSWKKKFFKIRMTTGQDAASSANARQFVEGWIPVIWSP